MSSASAAPATDINKIPLAEREPILQTEKLVKVYTGRAVVNGVDINVRKGEIVGVLGPNGAG